MQPANWGNARDKAEQSKNALVVPEKFTLRCQNGQLTAPKLIDVIGWRHFCDQTVQTEQFYQGQIKADAFFTDHSEQPTDVVANGTLSLKAIIHN